MNTRTLLHKITGAFLTLAALAFASVLISTLYVLSQFPGNAAFPVECAVVFGSAVHNSDEAGPGIRRRTETGVRLLREGSVSRLIFTGGTGEGNRLSEARVMRNEALKQGVNPEVLQMEEGAESTWQNVKFVRSYVDDCADVVAVSDRYHLARIRLTAWRQKIDMQIYPADRIAPWWFEMRSVAREALGNAVYILGIATK